MLACVIHCRQHSATEWAVGCNFSAELEEWQLWAFGARQAAGPVSECRGAERFSCQVKALCQLPAVPDRPPFEARVLNVSRNGLALTAEQELPTGTVLSTELHGSRGANPLTMLACVVHVTTLLDGQRITGCNFIRELTSRDMELLL